MDQRTAEGGEAGRKLRMIILRGLARPHRAWGHQVVDDGDSPRAVFEDFRKEEGLEVCLRAEAEAEAVLGMIEEPSHLAGEEAVVELMRRVDLAGEVASVSFGLVRRVA